MFFFFSLFSSFALICATFVVISNNPVYSVLFLTLSFFNVSSLLILLSFDFLPVVFIVVYVGAIAVLFLFVIMTISIKLSETRTENSQYFPILFFVTLLFFVNATVLINTELSSVIPSLNSYAIVDSYAGSILILDSSVSVISTNNIKTVGYLLFGEVWFSFVFVGIVLLFAMIASITLTLHKNFMSKTQNAFLQSLREFNTSIFFYS